ncbi:MAG: RNA polymerase sigma factor [Phycisphaerae bacterium]
MSQSTSFHELCGLPASVAIPQLVEEFGGQIYSLGLRFCGDRADAEDLVQEVFLSAFRAWDSFEGRSHPKTWLYTIAARVCHRMHRKRASEPAAVASLDVDLPFDTPWIAAIPTAQSDAVQTEIRREAQEKIETAIAALPPDFRIPLVLKEIVGFSVPEVAEILGMEPGTVKSRVHRARLRLRSAVDAVLPRQQEEAPPPAYSYQTCLDLLNAKQEALDRGAPFDAEIICRRCASVFASLDLTQEVCRNLKAGKLPTDLRTRLEQAIVR